MRLKEKYKDLSGNSGVIAYEAGEDYIGVEFADGVYWYTYKHPGKKHVEEMKKRARQGQKLSTYISQHIRENYESKGFPRP